MGRQMRFSNAVKPDHSPACACRPCIVEAVRELLVAEREIADARAEDRGLTYTEAAQVAGCSPETISNLVRTNQLPAIWLGRKAVVLRSTLIEFLRTHQGHRLDVSRPT